MQRCLQFYTDLRNLEGEGWDGLVNSTLAALVLGQWRWCGGGFGRRVGGRWRPSRLRRTTERGTDEEELGDIIHGEEAHELLVLDHGEHGEILGGGFLGDDLEGVVGLQSGEIGQHAGTDGGIGAVLGEAMEEVFASEDADDLIIEYDGKVLL